MPVSFEATINESGYEASNCWIFRSDGNNWCGYGTGRGNIGCPEPDHFTGANYEPRSVTQSYYVAIANRSYAKPGTSVSTDLRIKQSDGGPNTLQVSLLKFGAFGDAGKPQLLDRGPGDTYFDWVKFDKTHFTAPSDVWQTVHMTINVPKDAANGYYYAVTFTRAATPCCTTWYG